MKNFFSNRSLRFKIMSLCFGAIIFLGLCSLGVLNFVLRSWTEQQRSSFEAQARTLGNAVAAQFYERYGDVQAFAMNPVLQTKDKARIVSTLNAYSAMYGIYDLIMVVDAEGKLMAVNSLGPDGKNIDSQKLYTQNFAREPWFRAVIEGKFTQDKAKSFQGTYFEPALMDPYASASFGGNRLGSGFSAPIRDEQGKVIGVVSNRAGARWFEAAVKEVHEEIAESGFPKAELSIYSASGERVTTFPGTKAGEAEVGSGSHVNVWKSRISATLAKGGSSAEYAENDRTGEEEILAIAEIDGSKFISEIGWFGVVEDHTDEALASIRLAQKLFYGVFIVALLLVGLVAHLVSKGISVTLSKVSNGLSVGSSEVGVAVTELSAASTDLSTSSQQQSAALQETSSAVEEISAMVKRSAELAKDADLSSQESKKKAEQGGKIVTQMIESMAAINQSTEAVAKQMVESNEKTASILKVIEEVGAKTKVINDIVFQTKLLSFNASVEAARAGDHGKGFAVVAEEVGNLAQMSGNAAKEINKLLGESISSVTNMVNETREKVEGTLTSARSAVNDGNQVARACEDVLKEIVDTSGSISRMVTSISEASAESARGVSEISTALHQLDDATNTNALAARSCAEASEKLNEQVIGLRGSAESLNLTVDGKFRIVGFEWKDIYALGVNKMDDEHKVLITKINALADALAAEKGVMNAFEALASYTVEHFSHEERYMESIAYPDLAAHKRIHARLLEQVGQYGETIRSGNANPSELMNFLNDWLLKHILGVDMKYARFSREEKSSRKLSLKLNDRPNQAA